MEVQTGELEIDEARLREADPDGLYLFMLEDYPYMMTPDHVAAFTARRARRSASSCAAGTCRAAASVSVGSSRSWAC